jgi:hypothetical protein
VIDVVGELADGTALLTQRICHDARHRRFPGARQAEEFYEHDRAPCELKNVPQRSQADHPAGKTRRITTPARRNMRNREYGARPAWSIDRHQDC